MHIILWFKLKKKKKRMFFLLSIMKVINIQTIQKVMNNATEPKYDIRMKLND